VSPLKKLTLFIIKLIVVYIIVFVFWIVFNPYYNHLLGVSCSRLLPVFSSGVITVHSVKYESHAFKYNYIIRDEDRIPVIKEGVRLEQLGVPLIIFLTLMLITPNILLFLSYVFLTIVILLGLINQKYPFIAQSNFMGKFFSIRANYKIAGFFLVFGQQVVPIFIWLILCLKPLSTFGKEVLARKKPRPKPA
jgi:hypothetical protein